MSDWILAKDFAKLFSIRFELNTLDKREREIAVAKETHMRGGMRMAFFQAVVKENRLVFQANSQVHKILRNYDASFMIG